MTSMSHRPHALPDDGRVGESGDEDTITDHNRNGPSRGISMIRDIPKSNRHFWKSSYPEQWLLSVGDRGPGTTMRFLAKNETTVMGLNEIAAREENGRGFFFHLRNKDFWKKPLNADLCPEGRGPHQPGVNFPEILYLNYVWDGKTRSNFFAATHRSRYLKCDGLINLPTLAVAPLYAIQFASAPNYPLYTTSNESLVVLATESTFYLASTLELEGIIGKWPKGKRKPAFENPEARLDTAPYLWKDVRDGVQANKKEQLGRFANSDLQILYHSIVRRCHPDHMPSTFSTLQFKLYIPRPLNPPPGVPLGSTSNQARGELLQQFSNPTSRRDVPVKRGRRKVPETDLDAE